MACERIEFEARGTAQAALSHSDTLWYYRELAKAFQDLLPGQLADELMEIVIVLENE